MSCQVFKEALDLLPGGVNSPVRAFKSVGGQPIVFDKVKGAYVFDVDNNKCALPQLLCLSKSITCCTLYPKGLTCLRLLILPKLYQPDALCYISVALLPLGRGRLANYTLLAKEVCRYIDYVLSWGPAIAGHAVDEVNDALKAQIDKGTSFGAPCELEVSLTPI